MKNAITVLLIVFSANAFAVSPLAETVISRQESLILAAENLRKNGRNPEEAEAVICYATACSNLDKLTIKLTVMGAKDTVQKALESYK